MGVDARGFPGGLLRLDPTFVYVKPPSSWPLPQAKCLTLAPNRRPSIKISITYNTQNLSSFYNLVNHFSLLCHKTAQASGIEAFPAYEWLWMRVKESLVTKRVIAIVIFKITLLPLHFTFFFLKEFLMKNCHHWNHKDCFYHCSYNNINYAVYYYIKCRGFLLQVNMLRTYYSYFKRILQFKKDSLQFFYKKNPHGFKNN